MTSCACLADVIGTFAAAPLTLGAMCAFLEWVRTPEAAAQYAAIATKTDEWVMETNGKLSAGGYPVRVDHLATGALPRPPVATDQHVPPACVAHPLLPPSPPCRSVDVRLHHAWAFSLAVPVSAAPSEAAPVLGAPLPLPEA